MQSINILHPALVSKLCITSVLVALVADKMPAMQFKPEGFRLAYRRVRMPLWKRRHSGRSCRRLAAFNPNPGRRDKGMLVLGSHAALYSIQNRIPRNDAIPSSTDTLS